MTAPYLLRLLCLSLASFFLLHFALAAVVAAFAGRALRAAEAMTPRAGARLLLGLRLLPPVVAALLVAGICAPSYLWLEPEGTGERAGIACIAAAALGGWICAAGIARAIGAAVRSRRYLRQCRAAAAAGAPVMLLAGVFRPRLIVSRGVRRALDAEQLAAAVRHERAHRTSRDNLKRLLLAAAPGVFPFRGGLRRLERGWARLAEWAADDRAAAGDPDRSLALAGALVRMARLVHAIEAGPLACSLVGDTAELAVRVERLLNPAPVRSRPILRWPALVAAAGVAAVLAQPGTLYTAHRILEEFMR
ncbi:MAG TPA: hypothetical protein VKX45_05255 [Bryobacteraceae bacterium]|jgi:hypothetical protein|nr:hypothetical protein [Bryobacteraceae bacterium]